MVIYKISRECDFLKISKKERNSEGDVLQIRFIVS